MGLDSVAKPEQPEVQVTGPFLSIDKPGWWWVMHTCNDIYNLESVCKDVEMMMQLETDVERCGPSDACLFPVIKDRICSSRR